MNIRETPGHVEYSDDRILQAIEDANSAASVAEEEARDATDREKVFERYADKADALSDRIFMRWLRNGDKQALSLFIVEITRAYAEVVAEKKAAILARKPDDELH